MFRSRGLNAWFVDRRPVNSTVVPAQREGPYGKIYKRSILGLVIILFAISAAYAWNSLSAPSRWARGYSQVAEGDPEQRVVDIMGQPSEKQDCYRPRYSGNDALWRECAEKYWYYGYMEEWVVVVGTNGKVVAKGHSVSP